MTSPADARAAAVRSLEHLRDHSDEYNADAVAMVCEEALAALGKTVVGAGELYEALKHGDEDHQRWLREAIDATFTGQPVPAPYGKARSQALIESLQRQVAALAGKADKH